MKETLNKIKKYVIRDIKLNYKAYIIFLLIMPWFFIEFNYYIFTPGGLIDVSKSVTISDAYDQEGSFNMTYVASKKGLGPLILLSYLIPSWDLVSIDDSRIENESSDEIFKRGQLLLQETSYDAIIAAFNEANVKYKITSNDVTIIYVLEKSNTNLRVGDIIKTINGVEINTYDDVSNIVSNINKEEKIVLTVSRNDKIVECYANTYKEDGKYYIGIMMSELKHIDSKIKVDYKFDKNESGSSRGLMCALEIYNRITKYDLTKGDVISGTGTIDENGVVGAIDGVKYKLSGAVKKKAKVFIVPSENYEEALKLKKDNNYNIEIIEADNLHNVVEKLKNR